MAAGSKQWIVADHGATADADRVEAGPERVGKAPGHASGDPLRLTQSVRDAMIEGGGQLERNPGPGRGPNPVKKPGVLLLGLLAQQAQLHLDAGVAQPGGASRGHGMGIRRRDHYPAHARIDDGIDTGRLLAEVCARLEGHHQRSPARPGSRCRECHALGVLPAGLLEIRIRQRVRDRLGIE